MTRHKHSDYMHWAKTHARGRYDLSTSGVGSFPLRELPFDFGRLEVNGNAKYGYPPLLCAIAQKYGVDPDCVVHAPACSMANHLAMAALIEPGDEVLIEHPAYGPLLDVALYLQADVKRFARTEESGFAVDPAAVRRAITPKTTLIVLTNLHNPSSALTPDPVLREVGDIARSVGARVLVDEVYLDAVYENTPRSSFHLGEEFVVTNSLTKVYGLSGLRCGWILARPALAHEMKQLNNIYAALAAHPAEILSLAAFEHLDSIRDRARRVVEADRAVLRGFLESHPSVSAARTAWGTTAFLRTSGEIPARLQEQYDTSVVPGHFFEMPDHFRIGMGEDSQMFAEGMRRIGEALSAASGSV